MVSDGPKPVGKRPSRPVSLKAAALALLARREYSRHELAQRLAGRAESPEELERVLDEIQARNFQSDARFVESLVHRRAGQFGIRRIAYEIERHRIGAADAAGRLAELGGSERERALAVLRRRFSAPPVDLAEKGRQYRFLAQRGFDSETIRWAMKAATTPES